MSTAQSLQPVLSGRGGGLLSAQLSLSRLAYIYRQVGTVRFCDSLPFSRILLPFTLSILIFHPPFLSLLFPFAPFMIRYTFPGGILWDRDFLFLEHGNQMIDDDGSIVGYGVAQSIEIEQVLMHIFV